MIVQPNFLDHWKTYKLIDLLGGDKMAPLYVLRIWSHCQNIRSEVLPLNAVDLRSICRCECDPEKLKMALVESGFLEEKRKGLVAHEWMQVNKRLFSNRENGRRGGRPRNEPNNNPSVSDDKPDNNLIKTRSKGNRVEKSRVEKTPPVVPPRDREGDSVFKILQTSEVLRSISYEQDLVARKTAGVKLNDPRLPAIAEKSIGEALLMGDLDHPAKWWQRFIEREVNPVAFSSSGPQKKESPAPRVCDPNAPEVL